MTITESIRKAGEAGKLLDSSVRNLTDWVDGGFLPEWALGSIRELVEAGARIRPELRHRQSRRR